MKKGKTSIDVKVEISVDTWRFSIPAEQAQEVLQLFTQHTQKGLQADSVGKEAK